MIRGSCLCGEVRFEVERVRGPFELCHCNRCRKTSGSSLVPWLTAAEGDFRFVHGQELISKYDAPILEAPPAYCSWFCSRCGSSLPSLWPDGWSIPAGTLDDDPQLRPDRHIYVDLKAPWDIIGAELPQMTKTKIRAHRAAARKEGPDA